ncbi:kelch-like protein 11 [Glandiceps talaboti]
MELETDKHDVVQISRFSILKDQLQRQRQDDEYCDMAVVVDGREFKVHRNILAAFSPYFQSLFRSNLKEAQCGSVELECTSADAMAIILDYIYTGDIELTQDNVVDILKGADHLLLADLTEICEKFMKKHLTVSNCLKLRNVAEMFHLQRLSKSANKLIENRFYEVMKVSEQEILAFPVEQFRRLLTNERLAVREDFVFDLVIKWTNHKLTDREALFPELFNLVRLGHVSVQYLLYRSEDEPLIQNNSECRKLVTKAMRFKVLSDPGKGDLISMPRSGMLMDVIVLAGGYREDRYDPENVYNVFTMGFIINENRWVTLDQTSFSSEYKHEFSLAPAVVMDNKMVVLSNDATYVYDPMVDKWDENSEYKIPTTNHKHEGGVAVVCNGKLYAIGGDSEGSVNSMEEYDPSTNTWVTKATALNIHRRSQAFTLNNKDIHVVNFSQDRKFLPNNGVIDCYDTQTDEWVTPSVTNIMKELTVEYGGNFQFGTPILVKRQDSMVITILGETDVVVSQNGFECEKSEIPKIHGLSQRDCQASTICDNTGDTFVCGGETRNGTIRKSTFLFQQSSQTWKVMEPPPYPVVMASCCALQIPYEVISRNSEFEIVRRYP